MSSLIRPTFHVFNFSWRFCCTFGSEGFMLLSATWTDLPGYLFCVCQPYFINSTPTPPSNIFLILAICLKTLTFVICSSVEQVCAVTEGFKNGRKTGRKYLLNVLNKTFVQTFWFMFVYFFHPKRNSRKTEECPVMSRNETVQYLTVLYRSWFRFKIWSIPDNWLVRLALG